MGTYRVYLNPNADFNDYWAIVADNKAKWPPELVTYFTWVLEHRTRGRDVPMKTGVSVDFVSTLRHWSWQHAGSLYFDGKNQGNAAILHEEEQ